LKAIETDQEREKYLGAVEAVFQKTDQLSIQRFVHEARSARPDLDLICLSPEADVAAFSTAWFDQTSGVAEFEPVGTQSQFQRRGLASALLSETCNRLRAIGCREVRVESWSESEGANRLYSTCGLDEVDTYRSWSRILATISRRSMEAMKRIE
jgi:ribosomal protein S18 acetylase RimI-like enzyme